MHFGGKRRSLRASISGDDRVAERESTEGAKKSVWEMHPWLLWARGELRRFFSGRFHMRLTAEGYCLVVAMLLIGLAALNTAAPLLYMMFAMMCSFFILSALLATNTIRMVSVRRDAPKVWLAGKPMPVAIHIRNGKRAAPSFSLRVQDIDVRGNVLGAAFFEKVGPRNIDFVQEYECLFARRGLYKMDRLELATRFPFGLIERTLYFKQRGEVLVLPQSIDVSRVMAQARSELGEFDSNRRGNGTGLYGLRDYTSETSAKDIHWKISARRGRLMVREYEAEEKRRAVVVLDNRIPRDAQNAAALIAFEKSVILAVSVADWLLYHEHEVELRTADGVVQFGGGPGHLARCRRALALIMPVDPPSVALGTLAGAPPETASFHIVVNRERPVPPGSFAISVSDFDAELAQALKPEAVASVPEPLGPPLAPLREGVAA
ncbi:hypothetical protein BH09SUM1_BH09SUM1_32290 [soil metagenome]